jgi:hypothetical protein
MQIGGHAVTESHPTLKPREETQNQVNPVFAEEAGKVIGLAAGQCLPGPLGNS